MNQDELSPVFYELVGRVVVGTTELEDALLELLLLIKHGGLPPVLPDVAIEEQEAVTAYQKALIKWGKESGTTVVRKLENLVLASGRVPAHYRDELLAHLSECCSAVNERHGVAHSVWLSLAESDWWGSRYPRSADAGADPDTGIATIEANEETMRGQVEKLHELVHWTMVWRNRLTSNEPLWELRLTHRADVGSPRSGSEPRGRIHRPAGERQR